MNAQAIETMIAKILKILHKAKFFLRGNRQQLIDLGLLYVSKSGAVVVGLLILPFFSRQLGPEIFGIVALIFSLQAFLLLLDWGMATMVGRDLAINETTVLQRYTTWRAAEWAISILYLVLSPIVLLISWLWGGLIGPVEILCCIILFWALTLQNIGQSALLARHHFVEAAVIQVAGLLARHGLTALVLLWIESSLACFIITQSAVAVMQFLVTRWRCFLKLHSCKPPYIEVDIRTQAWVLLRSGRSLLLFGLAGAAVMQLDKVIVSGFMSPRELGPYFLATTFCMTPISVLAGPVAQFFQPRLIRDFSKANPAALERTLNQFIGGIVVCVFLPAGLIWLLREPLIALWLQNGIDVARVTHYTTLLLPGVVIGALGYIPYTLLIAKKDYAFQSRMSITLTVVTLVAVLIAAIQSSVLAVCVVYALYHATSTISSWLRCIHLHSNGSNIVEAAARYAAILVLSFFCVMAGLTVLLSKLNLI